MNDLKKLVKDIKWLLSDDTVKRVEDLAEWHKAWVKQTEAEDGGK